MSNEELPKSVGLFGLGLIGHAIAGRLIARGVTVTGFDPLSDCRTHFERIGGQTVPADQVWDADVVVSAVFSTNQLSDLIMAAPATKAGRLVSVSTCDPELMANIAAKASDKGYDLIESPISGTSADLANGNAILLVAGDADIAGDLAPLFNALSRAHFHVGAIGNGNRAKLAINLILGLSRAAVAEGIVFAKAIGLDPAAFLDLALESAASSKVMASKGPKMVTRDFSPLGRITQCAKDADLIYAAATQVGQGLPMLERYLELLGRSMDKGEGDLDNSAVFLEIERSKPAKIQAGRAT